jgi:hypothetical protein
MPGKQILTPALALLLAVSFVAPSGARALADQGFTYIQTGGAVTVTGCDGACPSTIEIPALLGGYPVTSMGNNAFQLAGLTSVTIPSSVATIGTFAFSQNALTAVTIPDSVVNIFAGAFDNNFIATVTIPNSVTIIDSYVFYNNRLTTVTIGNSVQHIGVGAFDNNTLTSVTFLGNAPEITGSVFFGNNFLDHVTADSATSGWGLTWSGVRVEFPDARATARVTPTIRGTAKVSKTLTAAGTWTGYPTPTLRYQWYACTRAVTAARTTVPSTCKRITGATRSTFKLTSAQRGKFVTVLVKGTSLRTATTTWLAKTTAKVR